MTQFARGKLAFGFCDICGFRYNLDELKKLTKRNKLVNIRACSECWNPDQPQNDLGSFPVDDPQALRDPRPTGATSGRGLFGSDPVLGQKVNMAVGNVTVEIG
jgi:hypothetical protein